MSVVAFGITLSMGTPKPMLKDTHSCLARLSDVSYSTDESFACDTNQGSRSLVISFVSIALQGFNASSNGKDMGAVDGADGGWCVPSHGTAVRVW